MNLWNQLKSCYFRMKKYKNKPRKLGNVKKEKMKKKRS